MRVFSRLVFWPAMFMLLSATLLVLPTRAATITIAQTVTATVETEPVPHSGDSADDPAIWVHPTNPSQSTIIGTDKHGGLAAYDLTGVQLQYLPDGDLNNVDLRSGFSLGGQAIALVTAGNRSNDSLAIYRVDPATRRLEFVAARTIHTLPIYGSCMYHSPVTGRFYAFVNSEAGDVEQWELFATAGNRVDARKVRSFAVGSQTEGCVADDTAGVLYIAEEAVGIWKYSAEPDAGAARTKVDSAGGGHLVADIEGLTIADTGNGAGYLIASSQGDNSYAVYTRTGNNAYLGSFRIVDGKSIDGTSDTDGIDVTTAKLGLTFPRGVFVAQDGSNNGGHQNFKLVSLDQIIRPADTTSPPPTAPPTQRPTRTPTPGRGSTPVPAPTPPSSATCLAAPIHRVQASGDDGNVPANVLDNNPATRWSDHGKGAWLQADLGASQTVCGIGVAWYRGDIRASHFIVQGSRDGTAFADLYRSDSSGKTLEVEQYIFAQPMAARFLRVVVNGNTNTTWASITELVVSVVAGGSVPQNPPPSTTVPAPTTLPAPATAVPAPTAPPAPSTGSGIWMSHEELSRLPMAGDAWNRLKSAADSAWGSANIADQNSKHDQLTLAGALVYARTGDQRYRTKVIAALQSAIGTDANADPDCQSSLRMARSLAVSRNLSSYVIAADLIGLRPGTAEADAWAKYVQFLRFKKNCRNNSSVPSYNLSESHDNGSSNADALAGGARLAAALYLGDTAEVERAWQTYQRYAGDTSKCASCTPNLNGNGQTWSYTSDARKQVAINPSGATKNGHPIGGAIVNDQGRGGAFSWPPGYTAYPWEAIHYP